MYTQVETCGGCKPEGPAWMHKARLPYPTHGLLQFPWEERRVSGISKGAITSLRSLAIWVSMEMPLGAVEDGAG